MIVANDTAHRYPAAHHIAGHEDPEEVSELLAGLFEYYPDFRDIANALIDRYASASLSFELVDAVFAANNWRWPQ
ncbi:hypothetical protein [Sphingobium yanoikuyae]|uniref:hypothetical protein n=1 Tax=Sphingobium yanoikuyae TaxID=13690 RepID=UPI0028ABB743|nr:hypothetical protein [Sphingobium yanoikuyae]